jgi:hypothetical protein
LKLRRSLAARRPGRVPDDPSQDEHQRIRDPARKGASIASYGRGWRFDKCREYHAHRRAEEGCSGAVVGQRMTTARLRDASECLFLKVEASRDATPRHLSPCIVPKFPPRKSVKTLLVCLNGTVSINYSSMVGLFTLLNYCRLTFELFWRGRDRAPPATRRRARRGPTSWKTRRLGFQARSRSAGEPRSAAGMTRDEQLSIRGFARTTGALDNREIGSQIAAGTGRTGRAYS